MARSSTRNGVRSPDPPAHRIAAPTSPRLDTAPLVQAWAPSDLVFLQQTVGNRSVQRLLRSVSGSPPQIQRANPLDLRLPMDLPEALSFARQAKKDIDAAIATLTADKEPDRRNVADFVAKEKVVTRPLTPRHDSPIGAPKIRFFPGEKDYTGSVTADAETTHVAGPSRKDVWIRARQNASVDDPLAADEIADRLVGAVSEIAFTRAAHPGAPKAFDLYRARFEGLYFLPDFFEKSDKFDQSLDSKGPRTPHARAVFKRIYADDAALKKAYDADTGGIREKIDTYTMPEGMNQVNSPRLQKLRAVFFSFSAPVSDAVFPSFKSAIASAATPLDDDDRKAIDDSNDWQRLINQHVADDDKRGEIRAVIAGQPVAAAPPPAPVGAAKPKVPLTLAELLAGWDPTVLVDSGNGDEVVNAGDKVKFVGGALLMRVGAELTGGKPNSGLVVFVRAQVLRGAAVVAPAKSAQLPARGKEVDVQLAVQAPAAIPAGGDKLVARVEILNADKSAVLATKNVAFTATVEAHFTKEQAETAAAADLAHFLDAGPAGIIGKLKMRGAQEKRLAEAMSKGLIDVQPMTMRHDSAAFVTLKKGAPDPSSVGYFFGTTEDDAHSFVDEIDTRGATWAFQKIRVKRTFDVLAGAAGKMSDADVIEVLVHEAVHALDAPYWQSARDPIDRYKTEFRAYWMDGSYGPPNKTVCPVPAHGCKPAIVDPTMPAPGPKSPRARAIFEHLYEDYRYVKPAYDENEDGFRDAVDQYVVPDGINLLLSVPLERLRKLIEDYDESDFFAFRVDVQGFMGVGRPPADGVLSAKERAQIAGNRAWRDHVEENVPKVAEQKLIKRDLGIAQ